MCSLTLPLIFSSCRSCILQTTGVRIFLHGLDQASCPLWTELAPICQGTLPPQLVSRGHADSAKVTPGPNMVASRLSPLWFSWRVLESGPHPHTAGRRCPVCLPSSFPRRAADNPFPWHGAEGRGGAATGSLGNPVKLVTTSQHLWQMRKQAA